MSLTFEQRLTKIEKILHCLPKKLKEEILKDLDIDPEDLNLNALLMETDESKMVTQLPTANLPLIGDEILMIVQGGLNKQIPQGAFSSGNPTTTNVFFIEKTLTEFTTDLTAKTLVKGAFYKISGVHTSLYDDGTTSGTTIILQALASDRVSPLGHGIFYNPKYDFNDPFYGIWRPTKKIEVSSSTLSNFPIDSLVTADNGATGLTRFSLDQYTFFIDKLDETAGNWDDATTVTNYSETETLGIVGVTQDTPFTKVIWGGYVWSAITGNSSNSVNSLELNPTDWEKVEYSEDGYNISVDSIVYNVEEDFITLRYNLESGIKVYQTKEAMVSQGYDQSAIAYMQWGMHNTSMPDEIYRRDISVESSVCDIVNICCTRVRNMLIQDFSAFENNYLHLGAIMQHIIMKGESSISGCTSLGKDTILNGITLLNNSSISDCKIDEFSAMTLDGSSIINAENNITLSSIMITAFSWDVSTLSTNQTNISLNGNNVMDTATRDSMDNLPEFYQILLSDGITIKPQMWYNSSWHDIGSGGGFSVTKQVHTTGSTVTIINTTDPQLWLIVNPTSALPSLEITLPTVPTNTQETIISFGGDIADGASVVSLLTFVGGIIWNYLPTSTVAGDTIKLKYDSTASVWYANYITEERFKFFRREVNLNAILECQFLMDKAGKLISKADSGITTLQYKINAGSYQSFVFPITYSANDIITVAWSYSDPLVMKGNLVLYGKEN